MDQAKKVNVKIKKLRADATIPQYARALDAGFDLVAVDDVVILPGESKKIPTGLAFALPEGYELQIRPRSGIGTKTKLRVSNAPGTVDSGFRGEVCVLLDNISLFAPWEQVCVLGADGKSVFERDNNGEPVRYERGTYMIKKGDRIAQGVIAAVPVAKFEEVDELDETERGTGGFGHSGVKA